jgi:hypothetical protein
MQQPRKAPPMGMGVYLRGELERLADVAADEYDRALERADEIRSKLAKAPEGPRREALRYRVEDADATFNRWARRCRALADYAVLDEDGDGWDDEIRKVRESYPDRIVASIEADDTI